MLEGGAKGGSSIHPGRYSPEGLKEPPTQHPKTIAAERRVKKPQSSDQTGTGELLPGLSKKPYLHRPVFELLFKIR